jgi:hypothetical protein
MTQEQNGITHESNFISLIGNDPIIVYSGRNHCRCTIIVAKATVALLAPPVKLPWCTDRHSKCGADPALLGLGSRSQLWIGGTRPSSPTQRSTEPLGYRSPMDKMERPRLPKVLGSFPFLKEEWRGRDLMSPGVGEALALATQGKTTDARSAGGNEGPGLPSSAVVL